MIIKLPTVLKNAMPLFIVLLFCNGILNAQTVTFEWAKGMGGDLNAHSNSIAVDKLGNIYTIGNFTGTVDFNPGTATYFLSNGNPDGSATFISKLDAQGNFIWARQINAGAGIFSVGGLPTNHSKIIKTDTSGHIYVAGIFTDTFKAGGVFDLVAASNGVRKSDIFIAKLDTAGNFIWTKRMGGFLNDAVNDMAVDHSGNVYTTGYFCDSADFDPGAGTHTLRSFPRFGGLEDYGNDVFVSKLDANGNFVWAKNVGGDQSDIGRSIAVDALGNVYTTGMFGNIASGADFDPGPGTHYLFTGNNGLSPSNSKGTFFLKLDAQGNFVWAKGLTSSLANGIEGSTSSFAMDDHGFLYGRGYFFGTVNFGGTIGNLTVSSGTKMYVYKLDTSGVFKWVKQWDKTKRTADDVSVYVDTSSSYVYLAGLATATDDLDPGPGTTGAGGFIMQLDSAGNYMWAQVYPALILGFTVNANDNVYSTGSYTSAGAYNGIDMDPGAGISPLPTYGPAGTFNFYVHKMSQCFNTAATHTISSCGSYVLGNQTYTTSGIYTQTIPNVGGCDSVVTLNLTINNSTDSTLTVTTCDSFTLNGYTYTTSGTYQQTETNVTGCDSIITLNLALNSTTNTFLSETACKSFTFNDSTYIQSGTYIQNYTNTSGCDSNITLDLTINTVTITVAQNGNTLTADAAGAMYQWIHCDNGNVIIPGANAQSYTATADGSYAVIVFQSNCSDTSDCYSITGLSINSLSQGNTVQVYPNPATQQITVATLQPLKQAIITISNMIGQVLQTYNGISGNQYSVDVSGYAPGVYIIEIQEAQSNARIKVVKE